MKRETAILIINMLDDWMLDYLFLGAGLTINDRFLYQGNNMVSDYNDQEARIFEMPKQIVKCDLKPGFGRKLYTKDKG